MWHHLAVYSMNPHETWPGELPPPTFHCTPETDNIKEALFAKWVQSATPKTN